jgi:hypothetical protein
MGGTEHRGMCTLNSVEQPDALQTGTLKPRSGRLGRPPHLACTFFVCANRRYAHEFVKLRADTVECALHSAPDRVQA